MNGGVKKPELREDNDEDQLYRVLRMFLEPGIRISNDVYLEMLITHLSGKNKNASDCTRFLKSPKILNWIDRALDQWSTKGLPDHHIVGFTLRLLTLYIEDPKNFTSAREKLIFDR
uniref:Uncharacterized protein n=1 Tax=Lutzomyia longipalpis TaxID=7200 RepID=A0A1B0CDR9_LUTLO